MSTLIFVVAFCIVAVLVYMARFSGRLRVSERRIIEAPLAEVYGRVADFHQWGLWNPWLEHEADAVVQISVGSAGEASRYAWDSARIGSAAIEHLRLAALEIIDQRMGFVQPFRFRGRGHWQFRPCAAGTEVIWTMKGRVAFSMRAFAQTIQGMIALDYRYGLDRLASSLEPATAPRYTLSYVGLRDDPGSRYAYSSYSGPLTGLAQALAPGFAELRRQLASLGVAVAGAPLAVYLRTNIKLRTTHCRLGLPIAESELKSIPVHELAPHRAFVVRLQGSRKALEIAWYHAMQRLRIENIEPDPRIPPFEVYLKDGELVNENDCLTELHLPLRLRQQA